MWLFIVLKYIIKNVTRDEAGCATRGSVRCDCERPRGARLDSRERTESCGVCGVHRYTVTSEVERPGAVKAHYTMGNSQQEKNSSFPTLYMASARRRHKAALAACSAFTAGAGHSAAARS